MNKIEKMHLDAINSEVWASVRAYDEPYVAGIDSAATEAAKVTEQIAIEFAGWLGSNYFTQNDNEKWASELLVFSGCIYSTSELFQEFLKTKQ